MATVILETILDGIDKNCIIEYPRIEDIIISKNSIHMYQNPIDCYRQLQFILPLENVFGISITGKLFIMIPKNIKVIP